MRRLRLARLAKQAGVRRFLFSSSCSNYGASGDGLLDEQATLAPLTPYAVSKVRLEEELTRLADDAFTPVFLRNATAYGNYCKLLGGWVDQPYGIARRDVIERWLFEEGKRLAPQPKRRQRTAR